MKKRKPSLHCEFIASFNRYQDISLSLRRHGMLSPVAMKTAVERTGRDRVCS